MIKIVMVDDNPLSNLIDISEYRQFRYFPKLRRQCLNV